ncbi:uncharacterized protein B0I36DRAFT_426242 [Microdochium trichocladiopsis]|uniref:Amine oxidase n=1 Tax=Microdochium trichocladiopsis TaxID=1682393 RepID=A0A9P8YIE6_9PEZI|nr:uncharacterized protein B0I36DRAFT_426242 [Microdochium trichocladiopsis]KAH7039579.1 hypothetical protein B0I36DRAFT_426242 [Microdochium trichocladiopsis]
MTTQDGCHYHINQGLIHGVPSRAKISPAERLAPGEQTLDTIVIGAGYAGLVASRNLALQGKQVLLLEARDRIGGRTFTSDIDGYGYEMGGNWIHWGQPHVYAEVSRYSMANELVSSQDYSYEEGNYCSTMIHDTKGQLTHQEEEHIGETAMSIFCDVDGQGGRRVVPFPHNSRFKANVFAKWDKVSCQDRLDQIKNKLSPLQLAFLTSTLMHISGANNEDVSVAEMLRWWALCDYRNSGITDYGLLYKLKCGQTGLAKAIFDEAVQLGNLQYKFSAPAASVRDEGSIVEVTTRAGQRFRAKTMISTIPLNVLSSIRFTPPLPAGKALAAQQGHVNKATKTHFEVKGTGLRSWSGVAYPSKGQMYLYGDGLTPAGDTHIIAFGPDPGLFAGKKIDKIKGALTHVKDAEIKRVQLIHHGSRVQAHEYELKHVQIFHDWNQDEFSKGTWAVYPPEFATKYLDDLQRPVGRIHFASADWAEGWRGFIDGAIEQGARAALAVSKELVTRRSVLKTSHL